MKIRYKLMILLLSVSIVPILAIAVLLHLSINRVSEDITKNIQQSQMQDTIEQLTINLHNYRESVTSVSSSLMLAVKLQAAEVEKHLAENITVAAKISDEDSFGTDEDLDDLTSIRNSLFLSYPQKVDFKRQGLVLINGATLDKVQDDLQHLQSMTKIYHDIYQANRGQTLWHYTSLENGIHTNYPAGAALPKKDYDPRLRPWYLEAKASPERFAVVMIYDAVTEAPVLTVSMAVFNPDGSFAGVTAIDKPMNQDFAGLLLSSALRDKVHILLAGLGRPGEPVTNELFALMPANGKQDHVSWQSKPQFLELTSNDHPQYKAMMKDLMAGHGGSQIMDYDGQKSIWAYSEPFGKGEKVSLHMIIPYSSVLALAEQTKQRLFEEYQKKLKIAGLILLGVVVLTVFIAIIYAKRFTYPINRLATVAAQLSLGNFNAHADVKTGDELEKFASLFNDVGPKLLEHEKTQHNLVLAGAIQKNLLPKNPPILSNFDIAGHCQYCDETGGDYFDFITPREIGKPWVGIVLGDVTGHGITAALLMASARSILRNSSTFLGTDLVRLMQTFNDQLSEDTEGDRFITLFYGMVNDSDRSLIWASGGHDPAIWYHQKESTFEELPNTGPLMGCIKDADFTQAGPVYLRPGDLLIIGTDGIWEARDAAGKFYGKDRLTQLIAASADSSAEQIAQAVIASVNTFTAPAKPEDDITLIVIKTR